MSPVCPGVKKDEPETGPRLLRERRPACAVPLTGSASAASSSVPASSRPVARRSSAGSIRPGLVGAAELAELGTGGGQVTLGPRLGEAGGELLSLPLGAGA